jgi:hypothetical protein
MRRMSRFCSSLLVTVAFATSFVEVCDAQDVHAETPFSDKVNFSQAEGPYSYKVPSDLNELIGFITEKSGDSANFRDCKGIVRKVKLVDLVRVQRSCSSKGSGIWVLDSFGKIVLIDSAAKAEMQDFLGKAQLDPMTDIPASYREVLKDAKAGDLVAISSRSGGKLDLSLIKKPLPATMPDEPPMHAIH